MARILLEKYESLCQADESTFQILSFLEAVKRGTRLYLLLPRPVANQDLPAPLQAELKNLAHAFKLHKRPSR
jgi:hypothetical protein